MPSLNVFKLVRFPTDVNDVVDCDVPTLQQANGLFP